MATVSLRAHFDGKQILLDEPYQLEPNAKLMVTVLSPDEERDQWGRLALRNLERAYGPDEPDYHLDMIKEANPDYEAR